MSLRYEANDVHFSCTYLNYFWIFQKLRLISTKKSSSTNANQTGELANFLKEMSGGTEIPVDESMKTVVNQVSKEKLQVFFSNFIWLLSIIFWLFWENYFIFKCWIYKVI